MDLDFRIGDGFVRLRGCALSRQEGGWTLEGLVDAADWAKVDAEAAFHSAPEQRGPCFGGALAPERPVKLAIQPGAEVGFYLDNEPDVARALELAPEIHLYRRADRWRLVNATVQLGPEFWAGFQMLPRATPDARALMDAWVDMVDDGRADAAAAICAAAQAGSAEDRARFLDWLEQTQFHNPILWLLLQAWPDWAAGPRLAAMACAPGGPWLPSELGVVERRVRETGAWSRWIEYLVNYHLSDELVPRLGEALSYGAVPDGQALSALAGVLTGWAKDQLIPVCEAFNKGNTVARAGWRVALMKRLKADDPRWQAIGAAIENGAPRLESEETPWFK